MTHNDEIITHLREAHQLVEAQRGQDYNDYECDEFKRVIFHAMNIIIARASMSELADTVWDALTKK